MKHLGGERGERGEYSLFSVSYSHCALLQVDELNRAVSQIVQHVEKIKRNHNIILASVQNNEAKEETNDLMTQIKKLSHRVHGGLKRK